VAELGGPGDIVISRKIPSLGVSSYLGNLITAVIRFPSAEVVWKIDQINKK